MLDVDAAAATLAYAYAATMVGVGAGFTLSACFRHAGRKLTSTEAAICALMPTLALPAFAILSTRGSADAVVPSSIHRAWHAWADMLHAIPEVHGLLHVAHWLLILYAITRVAKLASSLVQMRKQAIRVRSLPVLDRLSSEPPVYKLDTVRPVCFVLGLLRPSVYVSQHLLDCLPAREQAAMLAHEVAHIRRRDGLMNLLFLAQHCLAPLPGSRDLYRYWQCSAERACDLEAARVIGNPYDVASALLEVARLTNRGVILGAIHFAHGEDIEERCHELLDPEALSRRENNTPIVLGTLASVAAFVFAETCVQHFVELFVNH